MLVRNDAPPWITLTVIAVTALVALAQVLIPNKSQHKLDLWCAALDLVRDLVRDLLQHRERRLQHRCTRQERADNDESREA